ncbi:basic salivary proline-rich protein 4-like [Haemorhous mexicanus]|uniref:basic salivary proline-rich protein 4-like n=1 Tax=Haemorhous mexicanus TaxID=30427 RepID=UPI0028BEDFE4|nr:basic salivary proline-rich protein 4-like [Haemorhous mexicanus]
MRRVHHALQPPPQPPPEPQPTRTVPRHRRRNLFPGGVLGGVPGRNPEGKGGRGATQHLPREKRRCPRDAPAIADIDPPHPASRPALQHGAGKPPPRLAPAPAALRIPHRSRSRSRRGIPRRAPGPAHPAARRPRYGRRSPGGRAGSARRPGIVVRPPPRRGGPAPGLPPCAACFLVLLSPSRLDSPLRCLQENRLRSLPPPHLLCFPGHRTRLQPPPGGGAEGGDRGRPGGAGGRERRGPASGDVATCLRRRPADAGGSRTFLPVAPALVPPRGARYPRGFAGVTAAGLHRGQRDAVWVTRSGVGAPESGDILG